MMFVERNSRVELVTVHLAHPTMMLDQEALWSCTALEKSISCTQ